MKVECILSKWLPTLEFSKMARSGSDAFLLVSSPLNQGATRNVSQAEYLRYWDANISNYRPLQHPLSAYALCTRLYSGCNPACHKLIDVRNNLFLSYRLVLTRLFVDPTFYQF